MTLQEILANEELRQHEVPVAKKMAFFGHAGISPLPRRVVEAMNRYFESSAQSDQEAALPPGFFTSLRQKAASFLGATPEEVAFVGPTSAGLSYVANGLKFRRTDNVVIYHDDYPSNVYPWMALAERGVEVRFLNIRELGRIRANDVTGQVDENTRLVALASCHFLAGFRIDLDAIGKFLRERKILFSVDAIQTLGAFPTSAANVDFMASGAHKWLLGPAGAGLLFVRRELQDKLSPSAHGWHNIRCPNFVAVEELTYRADARRYEPGTANLGALIGLDAALDLLSEIGIENIAAELLRKRAWVSAALKEKSYQILQADSPPERQGAMISFFKPGEDLPALHAKLLEQQIFTSLRADRAGQKYIRISPHFYNTDAELNRLLTAL
jgi:selenocysteine lyase/cysteine desulfurase